MALALVLSAIAVVAVLFVTLYERPERSAAERPSQPTRDSAQATAAGVVALPVVVVGADCATLGAAGLTEAGAPAYCARLASSGASIWSRYPGEIPHPGRTPGASSADGNVHVLVCMEQSGKSHEDCHHAILRENTDPGANDPSS
jgi:serine/threonine-protein kinase